MDKRYIFIGETLELPEFQFVKGSIYFGDKIAELLKKYTSLNKLLIDINEISTAQKDENYLNKIKENILAEIKGNGGN